MLIAQVTDTHVKANGRLAYGIVDTAARLSDCMIHLMRLDPRPDVILMTGDLVDLGLPEEYTLVRSLVDPTGIPVFVVPGNHDNREAMRQVFDDRGFLPDDGEFLHYVLEDFPVRLIGLDTTIPGKPGGELCADRLAWLDARLREAPHRPTVLFMHHPPFLTGIRNMDWQNCKGGEALAAVVKRHPQIVRLLCGHVHRSIHLHWHGITASIAPGPSHSCVLDLRADARHLFVLEPPSCDIHYWREDTGLLSHQSFIGQFEGPFPFYDGDGKLID